MSTIGIVQIRDIVYRGNGLYCSICFRSAADRKLVNAVHLKNFISKLATVADFKDTIRVCYVCEALAQSALRFARAVELASKVTELFANMNPREWNSVLSTLSTPGSRPKVLNNENIYHRTFELDKSLRAYTPFELRRTDTLVVASPLQRPQLRPQPRQDITVVMQHDDPIITPATPLPVIGPPAPLVPIPPLAPGPPTSLGAHTKISVDSELQHVRVVNHDTKEIVLHPMVQGLDGNIYVPSLQLQILNNGIIKSAPNVQNYLPTSLPPPTNTPQNSNNSKLQHMLQTVQAPPTNTKENNNTKKKERSQYYNFLKSQMEQKSQNSNLEIIKMNDLNIVLNVDDGGSKKKRKRSEGSMEKTLSEVQLLLNENAQGGCEIKYEIIDDEDSNVTKDSRVEPAASKEPVLKTDRTVDWEDKIPMDVISFMDATDPNPEERIMQPPPMGFISDVRSVPSEPIECIDLC